MKDPNDRHLQAPGEANRDKHINFLAIENGDVDPASESSDKTGLEKDEETAGVDNGFFTDDDNRLQTKEEHEEDKGSNPSKNAKVVPLEPATKTSTPGDKITVKSDNEDILTPVKDDDTEPYINEDDQAH